MQAIYENHYLDDNAVANYARHSFAKLAENFTPEQNHNLIRFLARGMKSQDWDELVSEMACGTRPDLAKELAVYLRKIPEHWVPFGHPHITLRVSAPVPIRTQCFKHKIGFVESEESRRYIKSTPKLYVPEYFRSSAADVKQGSGEEIVAGNAHWMGLYKDSCHNAISHYNAMVQGGVCPEQARFILPQGCEVNWVWTGSLYAYANFYNQRSDSHAQKEVQQLAQQVNDIIQPLFPVSWAALTQGEY